MKSYWIARIRGKTCQMLSRFTVPDYQNSIDTYLDTGIGEALTLIERKLRMLQIRGSKGEAVDATANPLVTKQMVYHWLSRRVNKMEKKHRLWNSPLQEI